MAGPILSPDGLWEWNGKDWVPYKLLLDNYDHTNLLLDPPPVPFVNEIKPYHPIQPKPVPNMINLPLPTNDEIVPMPTINIQDGVVQGSINQNVIHQTIANDYNEINSQSLPTKSDDREINKLLIGTGAAILLHVTWILISILAVTKLNDPSYPESEMKGLITWIIILYIISALVTFYVKFEIENSANPEENNGYDYINSLCQKSLLIPFAVVALIVIISLYLIKFAFQMMLEMSKQSSSRSTGTSFTGVKSSNSGTQQFVCNRCGNVKAGWRLNANCCGRPMRKL